MGLRDDGHDYSRGRMDLDLLGFRVGAWVDDNEMKLNRVSNRNN